MFCSLSPIFFSFSSTKRTSCFKCGSALIFGAAGVAVLSLSIDFSVLLFLLRISFLLCHPDKNPVDVPDLPHTLLAPLSSGFKTLTSVVTSAKTSADGSTTKLLVQLQVSMHPQCVVRIIRVIFESISLLPQMQCSLIDPQASIQIVLAQVEMKVIAIHSIA